MAVTVTEHQCQRVRCPGCAATVTGVLPTEVASSAFGPRLQAAIVTLSVRNRISRRDVVELCEQLFGARVSSGTVDAILTRVSDALADPTTTCLTTSVRASTSTWTRRAGGPPATGARCGARSPTATPCCGSPPIAAKSTPRRCSPTPARLSPRIAGGPMPTCRSSAARSAGRIYAATSRPTPKASPPRTPFGEAGLKFCDELFGTWEIFQHTGDRKELRRRIRALRREFKPLLRTYAARRRATSTRAGWRATC